MVIYTIGHSTRSLDEFLALLRAHDIGRLADVRTVPRSRRHPHFADRSLAAALPRHGVEYRHFPGLGGLRQPRPDSRHTAWRHAGFRGYADHMETADFVAALTDLEAWAGLLPSDAASLPAAAPLPPRLAIMCAEAVWWRCHRQLIADALVARGVEVRHVAGPGAAETHTLTRFAQVRDGQVSYPGVF